MLCADRDYGGFFPHQSTAGACSFSRPMSHPPTCAQPWAQVLPLPPHKHPPACSCILPAPQCPGCTGCRQLHGPTWQHDSPASQVGPSPFFLFCLACTSSVVNPHPCLLPHSPCWPAVYRGNSRTPHCIQQQGSSGHQRSLGWSGHLQTKQP